MKKLRNGIIIALVVAMFASFFALNINVDKAYADVSNYNQEIINSTNIDDEVVKEAASKEEPTKMYNLVVFIRFKDQTDFLNEKYTVNGKTSSYLDIIDASYNTSKYSLRNYYLTVSNNKLDITTIYLFASSSSASSLLISNYNQKYFLAHETRAQSEGYSNTEGYKTDQEMDLRSVVLATEWANVLRTTFNNNVRPSNAKRSKSFSYSDLDSDNDGEIDSLTLQYYPQKTSTYLGMEWSGPLWSYKSTINGAISKSYTQNGVSKKIAVYTFNQTYMNVYTLICDNSGTSSSVMVSISTCIHEMGHVLGLPDLYSYEDQSGTTYKDLPVGYWSVMGFNSYFTGQFSTSYEREKLNWIDSNNVISLDSEGTYTLDVVKGGGNDGIVAYKIPLDNGTKHLYLEYRNNTSEDINIFDSKKKTITSADGKYTYYSGVTNSGLLVYIVNTSKGYATNNITKFKSTNPDAVSWGVEVLSQYTYQQDKFKDNATLQKGESLGNKDLSSLDHSIYYYSNDLTGKKNSGLYITVTEVTEDTLTFEISGVGLLSNEISEKEIGNKLAYKRLLEIAGTNTLTRDSLKDIEYIDLSECKIDDVQFLNLFDLSNLKMINLYGNNLAVSATTSQEYLIANITSLQTLMTSGVKMILANNQIDLNFVKSMYPSLLTNQYVLWGVQCIEEQIAFNENIILEYQFNELFDANTTLKIIKIDATGRKEELLSGSGTYTLAMGAKYELVYDFYYNGVSTGTKITEFNVVKISSQYKDAISSYKVWNNKLDEINYLEMLNVYPLVENLSVDDVVFTKTSGIVLKELKINYLDEYVCSLSVYFNIQSPQLISQTDLDTKLYQILQTKYGLTNEVYNSDLIEYPVIDLSGQGLTSVKGLEKFILKDDVIINLSNNNLSKTSISEIQTLCDTNTNINSLVLINNQFESGDINTLRLNSSNISLVFALQNVKSVIISDKDEYTYEFDKYSDYDSLFNLTTESSVSTISLYKLTTKFQIVGCGKLTLVFENDIVGNINIEVTLAKVVLSDSGRQVSLNYGEHFDAKYEWFNVLPTNFELQEYIMINTDDVDFNTLGNYEIKYTFKNQIYSITQNITICDSESPVITLNGNSVVYVDLESVNRYIDSGASATDNYDKNVQVLVDSSEFKNECGKYKIYYSATDTSGNSATAYREVVVGSVLLGNQSSDVDIMSYVKLPILFNQFEQSEFDIKIKLNNEDISYDFNDGYKLTEVGENVFDISLECNVDTDLRYNLTFVANVSDTVAPVVTLIGNKTVYIYESELYTERGINFSDNSVEGAYSISQSSPKLKWAIKYFDANGNTLNNLNSPTVGDYYIIYTVTDNYGKGLSTSVRRDLKVIYQTVKNMTIDENNILPRYESGSDINIEVSVNATNGDIISMPVIKWYINGECVQAKNSNVLTYKFTKKGEYTVYAVIENLDKNGNLSNTVYSNPFVVEVYSTNVLTTPILYIVIGIFAVAIIGLVIYFVVRRKNRYFY